MDIRREAIWLIKRANTDESEERTTTRIVTPNSDMTVRAARNSLTLTALGRSDN